MPEHHNITFLNYSNNSEYILAINMVMANVNFQHTVSYAISVFKKLKKRV